MEPMYYTNAHNDYFKSISKRLKLHKEKERKHRSSITSFSISSSFKELTGLKKSSPFANPNNSFQGLQNPIPIATSPQPHATLPPIILVASCDYSARNKNEISVSANEHLKLLSRKGNGIILVKTIGRLSSPGLVPTNIVKIVDLDNRVGNHERHKYDMSWLNTADNANVYEKGKVDFNSMGNSNNNNIASTVIGTNNNPSGVNSSINSPAASFHSDYGSPKPYHSNTTDLTPARPGNLSVSKPTPVSIIGNQGSSTPEPHYSYESRMQYSKESTETIDSFEKELKRKGSSSTIGSSVSSIHSLSFGKVLSNVSSPALSDDAGLENDINYSVEEDSDDNINDEFADDDDDDLTGFDKENCNVVTNEIFEIADVCVSNVYNNNGRYWYKVDIDYKLGKKRFLRRYYQDFYDLHMNVSRFISSVADYADNEEVGFPSMPGPIPRPDPNNPSKALLQRCSDLNDYFRQLFKKLALDGYKNDVFEEWIYPRFGDYDMNDDQDLAAASLDNSIIFERPILANEESRAIVTSSNDASSFDDQTTESEVQSKNILLGSPKLCVPQDDTGGYFSLNINKNFSQERLQPSNNNIILSNGPFMGPSRSQRSPLISQSSSPGIIRLQSVNKNLPPIPMKDTLAPPTPLSISRHQPHNAPHPTPVNVQVPQISLFNQVDEEEDEEKHFSNKSNNDIMQEIESELSMQNVTIITPAQQSTNETVTTNTNNIGNNTGGNNVNGNDGELTFSQHQISGPQIRVKCFYNDGEDIFICKIPVSCNLEQLKNKLFSRIKDDFTQRNKPLKTNDIFLFAKSTSGMYSAIKDDVGLRGVIRAAKGKFSVRVEFD